MTELCLDLHAPLHPIRPLHSVCGVPLTGIADMGLFAYLQEAHIPFCRLHDVAYPFGAGVYVDVPNIFRDPAADPDDPAAYDFAFTDRLIERLMQTGCEPVYRLGVSIENAADIRAYRIYPPADSEKWARVCEHIVRHYIDGWADGFAYPIRYWEIWNEPDGHPDSEKNQMWRGTFAQYLDLYRAVSRRLRAAFGGRIRIGGYASCGFYAILDENVLSAAAFGGTQPLTDAERRSLHFLHCFDRFVETVAREGLPFDFFSYHSYAGVADTVTMQRYVERRLDEAGLADTEIHLNEWNTCPQREKKGGAQAAAETAEMLCAMQEQRAAMLCYYDARACTSPYSGLFDPMHLQPMLPYYALAAFGELYVLGTQVAVHGGCPGLRTLAAADRGGDWGLLLACTGERAELSLSLPAGGCTARRIGEGQPLIPVPGLDPARFVIEKNEVLLLRRA